MMKKSIRRALGTDKLSLLVANSENQNQQLENLKSGLSACANKVSELEQFMIKNEATSRQYLSNEYALFANNQSLDKKRVLICGFYGAQNVGDELMLESLLEFLDTKNCRITILLSNNYDLDASIYAPYDVVHYPKCSSDIAVLAKNTDVVLWGGGAMIDDKDYSWQGEYTRIPYILFSITKAVLKNGGRAGIFGVSANKTLSDETFLEDLQLLIDKAEHFSLRDANSLKTLKDSGIDTKKVKVIDDLALLKKANIKIEKPPKDQLSLGLIYIYSEEGFDNLVTLTKKLYEESKKLYKDVEIRLIPFYSYHDFDLVFCKKLADKLKEIPIEIENYPTSLEKLSKAFSKCHAVISMRYHGTLLSAANGKKTILIDYSDNHRHYYNKNKYIKEHYAPDILETPLSDAIANSTTIIQYIQKETPHPKPLNSLAESKTQLSDTISKILRK